MVYFAKKGNTVVHHTDIAAMKKWDKVVPQKQLAETEFAAYGNLVRLIDGKIFFGKTPKEKADDEATERIAQIDAALKEIDGKSGGRSMRAAILAIKETIPQVADGDVQKLFEYEEKAKELRLQRIALVESFDIPY